MKKFLEKKEKKIKNKILKKKKKTIFNILIKSNFIYNDYLKKINNEIIPFLYGIRYKQIIINLNKISLYLKSIFNLLKYIKNKNKNILIIANSSDINFLINKNYLKNNKNIYFLNKKWINGLITNNINKKIKNKKIQLIIIIKNIINDVLIKKELITLNIPIISCIKIEQSLKNINYPLINNLENIKSIYILMYLLRKNF